MKTIYLIRHAKSSWKDSSIKDFDRPLNHRGKDDATKIANELAKLKCQPDLILCSPAKRTKSTAKVLCKKLPYSFHDIHFESAIYEASLLHLIQVINDLPNHNSEVVLIGHNPSITNLYNYLTDDDFSNIPSCGTTKVEFEIDNWNEIIQGIGLKKCYIYPKMLENL